MQKENKGSIDLTRGSIPGGILAFAMGHRQLCG